jgi:hypothetical protein
MPVALCLVNDAECAHVASTNLGQELGGQGGGFEGKNTSTMYPT